jgi:WD40 repeat protein
MSSLGRLPVWAEFVLCLALHVSLPDLSGADDALPHVLPNDSGRNKLPAGAEARLGTTALRHSGTVAGIAISQDGRSVVSSSDDRTVRIWDIATGEERKRAEFHTRIWSELRLSENTIVIGTEEGVWTWDWQKETRPSLFAKAERIDSDNNDVPRYRIPDSCDISADKEMIVWADWSHDVKVARLKDKTILFHIPGNRDDDSRCQVVFHPRERQIAYSDTGHTIRVWDFVKKKEIAVFEGHSAIISTIAFSPDGQMLISRSLDGVVRFWDLRSHKQVAPLDESLEVIGAIALSPDGKLLAYGKPGGIIQLTSWPIGKPLRSVQGPITGSLALSFSPDGKTLAAAGQEVAVRLWKTTTGDEITAAAGHFGSISRMVFSDDGQQLLSAGVDGLICIWDCKTWQQIRSLKNDNKPVRDVSFSQTTRQAISCGDRGTLKVWDLESFTAITSVNGHDGNSIINLAFDAHLQQALSAGADGTLRYWEVPSGKEVFHSRVPVGVNSMTGLCGRNHVAFYGSQLVYWDIAKRDVIWSIAKKEHVSYDDVGVSPDGRMLAAIERDFLDRTVKIFETASGREVAAISIPYRGTGCLCLAFVCGGRAVACGAPDGVIRFVLLSPCQKSTSVFAEYKGEAGGVVCLAVSPDGKRIASGHANSTILVWPLSAPGAKIDADAKALTPRELEGAWQTLVGDDAQEAYKNLWKLVSAGDSGVSLLKKHLAPVARGKLEQITNLIGDLSSDDFESRRNASAQLMKIDDLAVPSLRKRLGQDPSLDERRHIEELLDQIAVWSPEQLRLLRAIQVLEYIGNENALAALKNMADGAQESRITQEAVASVSRLKKKR